jgi:hypothetical protein
MRCLVTAGKHVNTRAIARQPLGKRVPAETVSMQLRGKHTSITVEELLGNVFSVGAAPRLYNEDLRQLK